MNAISVFDILKIGVGPSSSHTLGPWRAVQRWLERLRAANLTARVTRVTVDLYGSLALTGVGHATDLAVRLALEGHDPETISPAEIPTILSHQENTRSVLLPRGARIEFVAHRDILFHGGTRLSAHANALRCNAWDADGQALDHGVYYSVGGGFVVAEGETEAETAPPLRPLPYPCDSAADVLRHCAREALSMASMVRANETAWRTPQAADEDLWRIWREMAACALRGMHAAGELPGGLRVRRRAAAIHTQLLGLESTISPDPHHAEPLDSYAQVESWVQAVRARPWSVGDIFRWVSCFALAVNEENAAMGRVVTAPTNGAAGVIPAVLLFHLCFAPRLPEPGEILNFLYVAAEVGSLFKKGATISAAMGGCQAEIGVSSAMAAAGLTAVRGGSVPHILMAAEIAMEHHLGLTCDPVRGLVQIPCIERNAMGAIKAINAAELALAGDPAAARVSLDQVIETMWQTAQDMNDKYKETSRGGLAVNVAVSLPEC